MTIIVLAVSVACYVLAGICAATGDVRLALTFLAAGLAIRAAESDAARLWPKE